MPHDAAIVVEGRGESPWLREGVLVGFNRLIRFSIFLVPLKKRRKKTKEEEGGGRRRWREEVGMEKGGRNTMLPVLQDSLHSQIAQTFYSRSGRE